MKVANPFIPSLVPAGNPARVRTTVLVTLAAQAALLAVLLIQGCKPSVEAPPAAPGDLTSAGPATNAIATAVEPASTNSATASTNAAAISPGTNLLELAVSNAPAAPISPAADTNAAAGNGTYTVVSGDSFYKIAQVNHLSVRALQAANPGVSPRKLKVGQTLNMPEDSEVAALTANAASNTNSASGVYVVKSGDTLSRIARSQHTTVKELRALNNLATDKIVGGQKLKVSSAGVQS